MNPVDVVKALDREISGGDLRKAADYLADDFQFVGVAPAPLNKQESIGAWQGLRAAMPDFNHNMKSHRQSGNTVFATVEVTGVHSGTLHLPDGGTILATGRAVRNPVERVAIQVRDGQAVSWEVEHVPGGGLAGLVSQVS